jgi:hypothetical protein
MVGGGITIQELKNKPALLSRSVSDRKITLMGWDMEATGSNAIKVYINFTPEFATKAHGSQSIFW